LTAASLPEDYSYVHRAVCIASDLIDLTGKGLAFVRPHSRRDEIPVYEGVMMCRWSPYVVRPEEGLAVQVAAGAVPKAHYRFLS
jgi:hypothetical protein